MSLKMMITKAVMFSFQFGSVIKLIGGEKSGIKSAGTMDYAEISIIYGTPKSIDVPDHIRWQQHCPMHM